MGKRCIVMFVKSPEKEKVKSRLAPEVGEDLVVSLYESFVVDMISTLERTEIPFRIAFSPADGEGDIVRRFGRRDVIPQTGGDLGERMKNAFLRAFADGCEKVVLIGSDIPDLTAELLFAAFDGLERQGAVIVPTLDGGYCLIGFRRESFVPEVFGGIPWSTQGVFAETLMRLERAGVPVHRLPQWRDVDTPEDLKDLFLRHRRTPFSRSRTMACLKAIYSTAPPDGSRPRGGTGTRGARRS